MIFYYVCQCYWFFSMLIMGINFVQCQHNNLSFLKVNICWCLIFVVLNIGKRREKNTISMGGMRMVRMDGDGKWRLANSKYVIKEKCARYRVILWILFFSCTGETHQSFVVYIEKVLFSHSIKCQLWICLGIVEWMSRNKKQRNWHRKRLAEGERAWTYHNVHQHR